MKDYETFKKRVSELCEEGTSGEENVIYSTNSKKDKDNVHRYKLIQVEGDILYFRRLDGMKKKEEKLDLYKLHKFYTEGKKHNTTEAKSFKLGGKQSPAVAVIEELKPKQ